MTAPLAAAPNLFDRAEWHSEHGSEWWILLTEDQVKDLAAGCVPLTVVSMARYALDEMDHDRQRAERPVKQSKSRTKDKKC